MFEVYTGDDFKSLVEQQANAFKRACNKKWDYATKIPNNKYGYLYLLKIGECEGAYGAVAAKAVVDSLKEMKYNGIIEYYAQDGWMLTREFDGYYFVGIGMSLDGVEHGSEEESNGMFRMRDKVVKNLGEGLTFEDNGSEPVVMLNIRNDFIPRGVVKFKNGEPVKMISKEPDVCDSWFGSVVFGTIRKNKQIKQ